MVALILGVFLLVVLMEGETGATNGDRGCDLLLDPVRPGILRVLLRLVLLVQRVCSGCDGAELGELLHVLVVLLLLAVLLAAGLGFAGVAAAAPHYQRTGSFQREQQWMEQRWSEVIHGPAVCMI